MTTVVHPGRLVFAGHMGAYTHDNVFYSDDGGATFSLAAPDTPTLLTGMDEVAIAELPNGTLVLNMRNNHATPCKCRAVSFSHDGGATWSPVVYDPVLISPVCEASLVGMNSRLYFSNPASTTARANLTIRRTLPDSTAWEETSLLLVEGDLWGGYSALVPSELVPAVAGSPGLGGILYERVNASRPASAPYNQDVITFQTFPLTF